MRDEEAVGLEGGVGGAGGDGAGGGAAHFLGGEVR